MAVPIKVGIIGASPDRGWARTAHIPAVAALPDYRLTAVAATNLRGAERAAQLYGAAHAFADPTGLARHPDVDLVVVAVRTPDHADLVRTALDAGKHVYCEWPLARSSEEAARLAEHAITAGVHHSVGLQARFAPAVRYARELLTGGDIGRIIGVNVYAARAKGARGITTSDSVYTLDRESGAGTLEVAGGHTLDLLEHLGGPVERLFADVSVRQPGLKVPATGERVVVTSPDHVLAAGALASGCPVSVHIHDGKSGNAGTRLEFSGTEGDLALLSEGPAGGHGIQISDIRLHEFRPGQDGWREVAVPDRHRTPVVVSGTAVRNVTELYAALAEDIRTGSRTVPDFASGLRLHELLDTVRTSYGTEGHSSTRGRQ